MQTAQLPLYQPLHAADAIRLLKIDCLESDTPESACAVTAHLQTFALSDPNCPPYTTVSYTWGTEYHDQPISVNGHPVRILSNIAPLLRMLHASLCKEFTHEAWFWIDSICINQTDLTERAAQVQLMGQIYRQAALTIVWLGEQSAETDQALDFLDLLADRRIELRRAVRKRMKRVPEDLEDHPGWKALEKLLQNPWWRRVWTLQEFLIPEDLDLYCGPKFVSRKIFRYAMDALELCGPLEDYIRTDVWLTGWNRRRVSDWYHYEQSRDRMSLVSLMAFCGDYGVTDPRDRIWAVHGLAREHDRQMIGAPTYEDDVRTTYIRLVENFITKFGSLDIICFAQLFPNRDPDWPSWVPDWRTHLYQPLVVPLMVSQSTNEHLANFRPITQSHKPKRQASFKASGEKRPAINFSVSSEYSHHLNCRGVLLDIVDGLGSILGINPTPVVESTSPINTQPLVDPPDAMAAEELLRSITRSLVLDRRDRHLETKAPVHQYVRELRQLVAAASEPNTASDESLIPPWLSTWWQDHKSAGFRMRGFTMEELCTATPAKTAVPSDSGQPLPKTSKSFFSRMRGTMSRGRNGRRLMVTDEGRVGIVSRKACKGDAVCVLFGCSVPVILRPQGQNGSEQPVVYKFIGECYLDGFMNGEAVDEDAIREFSIV